MLIHVSYNAVGIPRGVIPDLRAERANAGSGVAREINSQDDMIAHLHSQYGGNYCLEI